jgi:phage tail sheath protein FI
MSVQLSPGVNVTEFDLTTVVPAIGTTTGAIAGIFNWGPVNEIVLVDTESTLASIFFTPNANNFQTWFTAANFLSYGSSLQVVRSANTTSGDANAALNAVANSGPIANISLCVILNESDFETKSVNGFDANAMFIANYPGALGNALRISVCDSVNAYSSNVSLTANADVYGTISVGIGTSNVTITVNSVSGNVTAANAFATKLMTQFAAMDQIVLGNTTIGTQWSTVTSIINTSNTLAASLNLTLSTPYTLSSNYSSNSAISRYWEFQNVIGVPPIQTSYMSSMTSNTSIVDGQHIVIQDYTGAITGVPGTILETYTNLSRATDAKTVGGVTNYWKTVVNQQSTWVNAVNDRPDHNANSNVSTALLNSTDTFPLLLQFAGGQDGANESTASLATITNGYMLFQSTENVSVSLILQGNPIGGSTSALDGSGMSINNFQLASWLITNIAQVRKDCVVFITPDDNVIVNNSTNRAQALVNWRNALTSSSYAFMDSGYKYQYDRYNDINRYVPTNGDIAGLCVYTDSILNPWNSPAGLNRGQLNNVIKMRYNPAQADRDILYQNGINPVISIPGQGVVLYGDKTLLSKPSAFDRINVRRLFIVIEEAIALASKFTLFQLNDSFTRAQFVNLVTPYLTSIKAANGIFDFIVICDTTNNTPEVIDLNQFVADIYVKPTRSINFIQLNFIAVATGTAFSEVIGNYAG